MLLLASLSRAQTGPWSLFAMDNGVGRGAWTPEQQASALQEVGFDGISYNYTRPGDIVTWRKELEARGLAFYGLYLPARIDGENLLPPDLNEAIEALRGSGAVLWLIIPAASKPGEHDAVAVERIRAVADLAAPAGLRVVLYPHKGFYLETAEHALALVLQTQRANVGLTVNLCHELAAGNGSRLPEIIRAVAPCLEMVSINGATDAPGDGWGNYIKLLGEGDYDVRSVLRTLAEVRYQGPVGVQFYNVKGDSRQNLATTMRVWRTWSTEFARP